MKIDKQNIKTITPTDKQIKKMFVSIRNFQKNNIKYLLLSKNQNIDKTIPLQIITTNNTDI